MTRPQKKKLAVRHIHKFHIERAGGDFSPMGHLEYLDMRCECGMPMFVRNPSTHKGDGLERKMTIKDL